MKKIIKLIIAVISLSFVVNVNAATTWTNKGYGSNEYEASSYGDHDPVNYDNSTVYFRLYKFERKKNNEKTSFDSYCLDANAQYVSGASYNAESLKSSNAYWYTGLAAIIANSSTSTKEAIASTEIAVRAMTMAMKKANTVSGGIMPSYNYMYYNTTAKWLADDVGLAKKATGINCDTKKCFFDKMGLVDKNGNLKSVIKEGASGQTLFESGSNITKEAKRLFFVGLEAIANKKDSSNNSSSSNLQLSKSTTHITEKADDATKFVQYDYYDLTLNEGDKISNISINCSNCDANKSVSLIGYYEDDGKEKNISNLSSLSFEGSKKITFKVKGVINRDSGYDCSNLKYNISYDANNGDNSTISDIYLLRHKTNSKAQRFIAFELGNDSGNGTGNGSQENELEMDICGEEPCLYYDPEDIENMTEDEFEDYTDECCTDIESYCNDSNNPAQQQYCEMYDEYCGACDSVIEVPNACQLTEDGEESEVSIESTTGYVKSAVDDEGNENIKACLLMRKKDEAGHSYKVMENDYCKVFCKEDFTFELPGLKKLNSGTYFQLEATITGTKSCYTSEIKPLDSTDEDKIKQYNACVNMEVDYSCFDPVIDYEYDEIYNDQLGENNKFVNVGDVAETNKKNTYCYGDINDDYSCTGESSNTLIAGKEVKYIKSTVTKTGIYKTPSVFYTQHPSGTITTKPDATNATLINGLPVSLSTAQGRHQFKLRLQNIGEYYDTTSCDNGRLIGDENSILNKQNKDLGNNGIMKAEYMCYYDINCPECEFDCEGPLCEIEPTDCGGKECDVACLGNGCAYNNGLSYAYRTVSLNALNPNDGEGRKLGYNWDASKSPKVAETIEEIEANGENAYDEPEYSFTLTPAVISAIKTYNKTKLNNGGYVDESLKCNEEGINCESKFISDLQTGASGLPKAKVTVPENKFTSWLDSEYCKGTCTIKKLSGIGPSWK